jgi:hypothetical protein
MEVSRAKSTLKSNIDLDVVGVKNSDKVDIKSELDKNPLGCMDDVNYDDR